MDRRMVVKADLFDPDGTLIDSKEVLLCCSMLIKEYWIKSVEICYIW